MNLGGILLSYCRGAKLLCQLYKTDKVKIIRVCIFVLIVLFCWHTVQYACKNLTTPQTSLELGVWPMKLPIISEDAGAKIACRWGTGNNIIYYYYNYVGRVTRFK